MSIHPDTVELVELEEWDLRLVDGVWRRERLVEPEPEPLRWCPICQDWRPDSALVTRHLLVGHDATFAGAIDQALTRGGYAVRECPCHLDEVVDHETYRQPVHTRWTCSYTVASAEELQALREAWS